MIRVLIAGIGGASLGLEIAKCLSLAGGYAIYGCDISPLALGHYSGHCEKTRVVGRGRYIEDILAMCRADAIDVLIPGGDEPARLLPAASEAFANIGVKLAGNVASVVNLLSDKAQCFERLGALGFAIPTTVLLSDLQKVAESPVPAVVKPTLNSGGSSFVFFARDRREIELYATYLINNGLTPIAQSYLPHETGEYTVGILSNQTGKVEGAITLRRSFHVKLSVMSQGVDFVISSGNSQGHIDAYPEITSVATAIASAVESRGPLNVQGRLDANGRFVPFEINPRFSASTYLRALAGFNEVDYHVRQLFGLDVQPLELAKPGWYLRGFSEVMVADKEVIQ